MPRLIDTHSHLHLPAFDTDRGEVLSRMRAKGIATIAVGTNGRSSLDAIALAEREPDVFASVGYHPSHLSGGEDEYERSDVEPYSFDHLKEIAVSSKRVVAIGEAGIDETYLERRETGSGEREAGETREEMNEEGMEAQRRLFRDHIRLAAELNLPLIIHTRGAFREIAEILSGEAANGRKCRAVVHCFTGRWEDASMLIDLGLMISFTGIITFKPKKSDDPEASVLRVVERIPADRMMLETDAPWLAPEPHRGSRNEPALVAEIAKKVAVLRGETEETVARQTTENAAEFFRLSP